MIIAFIIVKKREKDRANKIGFLLDNYSDAINDYLLFFKNNTYVSYFEHSTELEIKEKYKNAYTELSKIPEKYFKNADSKYKQFIESYRLLHEHIERLNKDFINTENNKYNELFSNIDGKSLDNQQREAIITDEKNNLIIAGAGSGKTFTISGKVKYLCEAKGVKPEDILLISFTRKAAQEMTERINNKLGYNIQATTFHKLGLDILKAANQKVYDVKDDMRKFFEEYFSTKINDDKEMLSNLINFFAYYLQLPSDLNNFDSLGEMYQHEKSMDLETIKSKYDKSSYLNTNTSAVEIKTTLNQEKVKSLQEVEIANYLFLHGIKYEYEPLYPHQDQEGNRRAYHPDFYLPEYDIYIEHFGVNENNKCPWLSPVEEEKYVEDMLWKKQWHKQNNTKLLCTYSYYFSKGILFEKLEQLLKENGVKFKEIDLENIFNVVYKTQGKKYFSEFITLCCTFISLFKSNGYQLFDLDNLQYKSKSYDNAYFHNRLKVFKDIVRVLLVEYEQYLKDNNAYDFSDMINLSTKAIDEGFKVHPYKYVIIDEFQDISVARYRLIKSILDQTGAKLMCVGDDWQSIYRFAGSDINLFTSFEEYFGYTKTMYIEKTYRNSQQVIDVVGNFITKNPQQIKKNLKSDKSIYHPIAIYHYYGNNYKTELKKMVDDVINEFGTSSSILLLGRTAYDFEFVKDSGFFYGKDIEHLHYKYSPDVPITFMTVHRAKGLEADNVVLLNFENSVLGFPNKIADDPMLETVLSKSDQYLYAEERRLFYVAITRTKNKALILCNGDSPSEFKNDLASLNEVIMIDEIVKSKDTEVLCPKCKTGHLIKRVNEQTGKEFIGCSNYPKCDYTVNSTKAVENKRVCPKCGGFLSLRPGRYGAFYGCSNYPNCDYTEEYNEDKYCPKCGNKLYLRKGKYGLFWGCSSYPNCKYVEKVNEEHL